MTWQPLATSLAGGVRERSSADPGSVGCTSVNSRNRIMPPIGAHVSPRWEVPDGADSTDVGRGSRMLCHSESFSVGINFPAPLPTRADHKQPPESHARCRGSGRTS
jgi:hypothetical protein